MPSVQTIASERSHSVAKRLRVVLLAWLAMLGLDFLLNGALFAHMYRDGGPFFLAPIEAFRRIPFGYAAFLILAIGIVEIAYRLRRAGLADGVRLGLTLGATLAAIWSLSLFSIASLHTEIAFAFAFIWLALVLIGAVVAAVGLAHASLRRLALVVVAFDLLSVVIVVTLQSVGVVPTLTT